MIPVVDDIDRAQQREQLDRDAAMRAARQQEHERPLLIDGKACCRGCGEPIPLARLRARPGACRCIECQELHERGW